MGRLYIPQVDFAQNPPVFFGGQRDAQLMIDSHMQEALILPPTQSALDLYDLVCCKTRITWDKVPVTRGEDASRLYAGQSHEIHPLFGLARDLYQVLDSVEQLVAEKAIGHIAVSADDALSAKARNIQEYLEKWTAPTQVRDSNPQLIRDSIMAAEAIRWAVILRLNEVMGWEVSD